MAGLFEGRGGKSVHQVDNLTWAEVRSSTRKSVVQSAELGRARAMCGTSLWSLQTWVPWTCQAPSPFWSGYIPTLKMAGLATYGA
jgi:hypothetical protein